MVSIVLAAFDLILPVVPLKVALGLAKINFWAFQKIIMMSHLAFTYVIIFFNGQISIFPNPKATFTGTTAKIGSQAAQNN